MQSVKNSVGILSSFVRGNFGQIISKFTWQLPQQALGVLGGNIRNFAGDIRNISHSNGAILIETNSRGWGGFTLGSVIQAQRFTTIRSDLYRHEYGHYLQSQRLGPAYLPGIALPSLGSAAFNNYQGHSRFYTERWADRLSERFFDNRTEDERAKDRQRLQELIQKAKDNGGTWRRQDEEEEDEFER